MNVLGIIAEYNPFHRGHLYHLKESKKAANADTVVAIMSGNFVQRGEPALFDKWKRSKLAVLNGIDLVLELPFVYACNNAEYFAKGAIRILDSLGLITHISFGSESGQVSELEILAEILSNESESWKKALQESLMRGLSYPKARYQATKQIAGEDIAKHLEKPNNILAIEYLKQLYLRKSSINPITIKRYAASYYEKNVDKKIAGATAIRDLIYDKKYEEVLTYLPEEGNDYLSDENNFIYPEDFYQFIMYALSIIKKSKLEEIFSATEGLENRALRASGLANDYKSLVAAIKTKRYTETRIKRFLLHILFNLSKDVMCEIDSQEMSYARVLAFNKKGASLLRKIKKAEIEMPIITNLSKEKNSIEDLSLMIDFDILASDIYNLTMYGEIFNNSDYRMIPYKGLDN